MPLNLFGQIGVGGSSTYTLHTEPLAINLNVKKTMTEKAKCSEHSECGRDAYSRGMCLMHYKRWRKYGDPKITKIAHRGETMSWIRSILDNPPDECALWPYALSSTGYGRVNHDGKQHNVHRFILSLYTGEDPSEMQACHGELCTSRACCNPLHLHWQLPIENVRDMERDGTVIRGEKVWNSKLSVSNVIDIRDRRGVDTQQVLADEYGVSASHICGIQKNKYWAWL